MWLILTGINLVFVVRGIQQIGFNKPFGNNPMNDTVLIISMAVLFLFSFASLAGSLKTLIDEEGIYVRLTPFMFRYKFYGWDSISSVYIREYNPLGEFGGWGMRYSPFGKFRVGGWRIKGRGGVFSYTVSGKTGFEFVLENGKRVLVGTRQPDYLKTVLIKLGKMEQRNDG
jgi:hypothetical protein